MTKDDRVDDGGPHARPGVDAPAVGPTDQAPPDPAGAQVPPGPGAPTGPGAPGADVTVRFFDRIRAFGAVRPFEGRWMAGCCVAIARRTGLDPILVRGITVALTILGGAGVILYAAAWLFLPAEDGRIHAQELISGRPTPGAIWAAVILLLSLGASWRPEHGWGPFTPLVPGLIWVVLIAAGLIWWSGRQRPVPPLPPFSPSAPGPVPPMTTATTPPGGPATATWQNTGAPAWSTTPTWQPAPQPPGQGWTPQPQPAPLPRPRDLSRPLHELTLATLGVALLTCAGVVIWDRSVHDIPGGAWVTCLAAALGVVGIGVVIAGLLGRRAGGLAPIGVLLALTLIPSAAVAANEDARLAGEHFVRPTLASVRADGSVEPVDLGAGRLVLDLRGLSVLSGTTRSEPVHVTARVGAGQLEVQLPPGVAVEVRSQVGAGDVREVYSSGGTSQLGSGAGVDRTDSYGTGRTVLEIDAQVGLGELRLLTPDEVVESAR